LQALAEYARKRLKQGEADNERAGFEQVSARDGVYLHRFPRAL
jgi:hypothetical protein